MYSAQRILQMTLATGVAACAGGFAVVGCADFDSCADDETRVDGECVSERSLVPDPQTKVIQGFCSFWPDDSENDFPIAADWELTIAPQEPIVRGQAFGVKLSARAELASFLVNDGFIFLGGYRRAAISAARITVRVRSGATGDTVELPAALNQDEYTCTYDDAGRTDPDGGPDYPSCDPALSDENGANPGCTGLGGAPNPDNPCKYYFDLAISDDCSAGGVCDQLGERTPGGPCDVAGFCASDASRIATETRTALFTAGESGAVLFGLDDVDTFATIRTSGPNRGTWNIPPITLDTPLGKNGLRSEILGFPIALDCVMGVAWWHPESVNSVEPFASPAPDSELIAFPIQTP